MKENSSSRKKSSSRYVPKNISVKISHYAHLTWKYLESTILMMLYIIKKIIEPFAEFLNKFVKSMHYRLGALFPANIRKRLERMFVSSGITRNPEETLGVTLMYSIILPTTIGLITFAITSEGVLSIGTSITSFVLVWGITYMMLRLLIDRRTENIEKILPDLLSMVAQNMSAGMTTYNALWIAARPEFGPLALEIQKVARDTLTGMPLETALVDMGNRIESEKLERAIRLMIQGMRSGGELPKVLQEISGDIRTEQNLVKRTEGETAAQAMFILFSLIIGAPLLFAASSQFINIFSLTFSVMDLDELSQQGQKGMVSLKPLAITEDEFVFYAVIVLTVCSFFGSLLVGLMRTGKMTQGIPIIPVTMGLSVGIFLALRYALSMFFGGMMNVGA